MRCRRVRTARGGIVGVAAVTLVLVAGACTRSSDPVAGSTTEAIRPTSVGSDTSPPRSPRCDGMLPATVGLDVAGVGRIETAVIGEGAKVAILFHQAGSVGMCGFRAYAERLAEQGVRSVLVNQCGYGDTVCDVRDDEAATWPQVAKAAIARARHDGAERITLVGASAGGTLALVAASDDPGVDAVVDLSGPVTFRRLDAGSAAPAVGQQVLVITAPGDRSGPTPAEAEALVARMPSGDKRTLVAADQPGVHGWDLLGDEGRWAPLADTVQQVVLGD